MVLRPSQPGLRLATLVATWFGSGRLPRAPGTWGSLAALPFAVVLVWIGGPWMLLLAGAALFGLGLWASGLYAAHCGRGDPSEVVVDEVVGQWLTLLPVALDLAYYPVAFLAFRAFDIAKPWPVGWADRRLAGGLGIMVDDLIAALYAGALCYALASIIGQGSSFGWTY